MAYGKVNPPYQPPFTATLNDFGSTMASGLVPTAEHEYMDPNLRIFAAAEEGVHAQSIWIGNLEGIKALRDLCNKLIDAETARIHQIAATKNGDE